MSLNLASTRTDPSRRAHAATLGRDPGRGRLQGRRVLVVGTGQRTIPEQDPPIGNGRATAVPFGRQGTGWEVAQACLYLVSHEASDVNAHALVVDGGLSSGVVRAA